MVLGGDHIGPFPWQQEAAENALAKASVLVRDCVQAGYSKIHFDASMPCADDGKGRLDDHTIAERAARFAGSLKKLRRLAVPMLRGRFT